MNEPIPLRDASEPPNESVIAELERFMVLARTGELRGVVILGHLPNASECGSAGKWDGPAALWAFETWKHRFLHGVQEGL